MERNGKNRIVLKALLWSVLIGAVLGLMALELLKIRNDYLKIAFIFVPQIVNNYYNFKLSLIVSILLSVLASALVIAVPFIILMLRLPKFIDLIMN